MPSIPAINALHSKFLTLAKLIQLKLSDRAVAHHLMVQLLITTRGIPLLLDLQLVKTVNDSAIDLPALGVAGEADDSVELVVFSHPVVVDSGVETLGFEVAFELAFLAV